MEEKHSVESMERKINELESALRSKEKQLKKITSVFLRDVPHEIRTPMNSIVGFLDLLVHDEPDTHVKEQYIDYIQTSSQELMRVFDHLIDLSLMESSQIILHEKACMLKEIFDDLYKKFNYTLERDGRDSIVLLLELPPGNEDAMIYSDPIRLAQVLTILIENSIKYTDKGVIEFGFRPQMNKTIRFFVKDTGRGINEAEKEQLFDPFSKSSDPTTESIRGLGLGLAVARGMVKHLGGQIQARKNPEKGTSFTFELPVIPANLSLQTPAENLHKARTIRISGRDLAI